MRKDVKIGLSIGGILLAVLIVYALVPKNGDTAQYARDTDSANSAEGRQEAGASGTGAHNPTATPGSNGPSNGQTAGPEVGRDAPGIAQRPATTDTGRAAPESDATSGTTLKPIDWEKIVSTGIIPEDAKVPLAATGGNGGPSDDVFAEPQKGGPGGTVNNDNNWSNPASGHGPAGTPAVKGQGPTGPTAGATGGTRSVPKEHVIQQGEHLSSIALAAYGDARYYKEILKANPTLDERKLKVGTKIMLPDPSTFTIAKAQPPAARQDAPIDATKEYRVEQGDSLHKIAVKLYGKPAMADTLYELNKEKIGDDSSRVKIGMVLKLPQAPTAQVPVSHSAR